MKLMSILEREHEGGDYAQYTILMERLKVKG